MGAIGRTTLYEVVKAGDLTPIHIHRCVRFSTYKIRQYVASLTRGHARAAQPNRDVFEVRTPRRHPLNALFLLRERLPRRSCRRHRTEREHRASPLRSQAFRRVRGLRRARHPFPTLTRKKRFHGFWHIEPGRYDQPFIYRRLNDPRNPSALEGYDHPFGHRVARRPSQGRLPLLPRQSEPPAFEAGGDSALLHVHPSLDTRAPFEPVTSWANTNARRKSSKWASTSPRNLPTMCLRCVARRCPACERRSTRYVRLAQTGRRHLPIFSQPWRGCPGV